jgi:hypothetical protein
MSDVSINNNSLSTAAFPVNPMLSSFVIDRPVNWCEEMFQLPEYWHRHFDIVYAFDAETQQYTDEYGIQRNMVISYQISVLDVQKKKYAEKIIYPDGERISLPELISCVCDCIKCGRSRAQGLRICQIAHFGAMEWSLLKNRDELRFFKLIHKVPICLKGHKIKVGIGKSGKHSAIVNYYAIDTFLHAPDGFMSLKKLSSVTNTKKIDIGDNISDMKHFLSADKEKFEKYAICDVRVTIEYEARFLCTVNSILGRPYLPATLASFSVSVMYHILMKMQGLTEDDKHQDFSANPLMMTILGRETMEMADKKGHKVKIITESGPLRLNDSFCAGTYHGGLNSSYAWGQDKCSTGELVLDMDLCSAYPTSLSSFHDADFFSPPVTGGNLHVDSCEALEKYLNMDLRTAPLHGYVQIDFEWESKVCFPMLPCHSGTAGLIYPIRGTSACTLAEVVAALATGQCHIDIRQYIIYRSLNSNIMPEILRLFVSERGKYEKNTLSNLLWKQASNSLYGKLTQGIQKRTIYEMDGSGSQVLPKSKITCVPLASSCTGLTRAVLASLIYEMGNIAKIRVLSATTDGLMIAAPCPSYLHIRTDDNGMVIPPDFRDVLPNDLVTKLESNVAVKWFMKGRANLGQKNWIEVKHVGDNAGTYRTRVNWLSYKGVEQSRAASGIQVKDHQDIIEIAANDDLSELMPTHLTTVRNILEGDAFDIVEVKKLQYASAAPDGKRILSSDGKSSLPPQTVLKAEEVRDIVKNRRKMHKTVNPEMLQAFTAVRGKARLPKGATVRTLCRKMVLRAIAHRTYAWRSVKYCSNAEIARKLGKKDLKNESRQVIIFNAVPDTAETRDELRKICESLDITMTEEMISEIMVKTAA